MLARGAVAAVAGQTDAGKVCLENLSQVRQAKQVVSVASNGSPAFLP